MMNELNNEIEEIVFNFASNAAEWGQRNPEMDVNVERMMSREIAKDYTEDLVALITEQVRLGRKGMHKENWDGGCVYWDDKEQLWKKAQLKDTTLLEGGK